MLRVFAIICSFATLVSAQRVAQPARGAPPVPSADASSAESELPDASAIGALALLPKDVAALVARIEGPDGHPFPERWYVLVHDPGLSTGLREYVFADGKAVANRGLSQFASTVSPDEVIGAAAVKVNSSEAAGIAAQFSLYNGQLLGGIRYELLKVDGAPVWRLTCSDRDGQFLGTIVLHATKGTVVSFDGFEESPAQGDRHMVPLTNLAETDPVTPPAATERPTRAPLSSSTTSKSRPKRRVQTASRRSSSAGPIDKVGNFFRKVFR